MGLLGSAFGRLTALGRVTRHNKWLLFDRFLTDRAAGAVNGSMAEPIGGARVAVDTENKLSISGGAAVFAGGKAVPAWGDPGMYYPAQARKAGRALVGSVTPTAANKKFVVGWNQNADTGITHDIALYVTDSGALSTLAAAATEVAGIGAYSAATAYQYALILRGTGSFIIVKGGAYTQWTLLWVQRAYVGSSLYPTLSDNNAALSWTLPRVIDLPAPWTTDYGPAALYAAAPAVTPGVGAELLTNGNMEAGDPPSSWVATGAGAVLDSAADERTGGAGAASILVTRGPAYQYPSARQQIVGVVGAWYRLSAWRRNVDAVAGLYIELPSAAGGPYSAISSSGAWNQITIVGRAANTAFLASLNVNSSGAEGTGGKFDDASLMQFTLPSLLASGGPGPVDYLAESADTIPAGFQGGVMTSIDSLTTPASYLLAYHDRTNAVLVKCVAGTVTGLISAAATYVAGARLVVRKYANKVTLYYNNAIVGTEQTVDDAQIITNSQHAAFATDASVTLANFAIWPAYPALPGYL